MLPPILAQTIFTYDMFPTRQPRSFARDPNAIEAIFENSVDLFARQGLDELADKWQTILNNYRLSKVAKYR